MFNYEGVQDTILKGSMPYSEESIKRLLWETNVNPLDELMFIQMTVRTRNGFSAGVYNQPRKEVRGDWGNLLKMTVARVRRILRPAGMSMIKTSRFTGILHSIRNEFGGVTLKPLQKIENQNAEVF